MEALCSRVGERRISGARLLNDWSLLKNSDHEAKGRGLLVLEAFCRCFQNSNKKEGMPLMASYTWGENHCSLSNSRIHLVSLMAMWQSRESPPPWGAG